MKDIFKGVISSLTATVVIYVINKGYVWDFSFPLWIWLCISVGVLAVIYIVQKIILWFKVRKLISEFTEATFGDSYVYTWKYKRCGNGRYSAYGYEATDIRTKKPLAEMNNEKTLTCGHEVPEEKIKMIIQLLLIANIDKKRGKQLNNVLEYLYWTEDSSKHRPLH